MGEKGAQLSNRVQHLTDPEKYAELVKNKPKRKPKKAAESTEAAPEAAAEEKAAESTEAAEPAPEKDDSGNKD